MPRNDVKLQISRILKACAFLCVEVFWLIGHLAAHIINNSWARKREPRQKSSLDFSLTLAPSRSKINFYVACRLCLATRAYMQFHIMNFSHLATIKMLTLSHHKLQFLCSALFSRKRKKIVDFSISSLFFSVFISLCIYSYVKYMNLFCSWI